MQGAELLRDQAAAAREGAVDRWQEARLAVEKAAGLLGTTSSGGARRRLTRLEDSVRKGIEAAQADDRLVARLDQIRAGMEGPLADAAYAEAFRAAGLDLDAPDAMSERLKSRPPAVCEAVATALDAWSVVGAEEAGGAGSKRMLKAARHLDSTDPWRNRLRDALERKDLEGFRRLATQADVLDKQGPVGLWLLGYGLESLGDHPLALDVLRQGQQKYPGDYWLNLEMGMALLEGRSSRVGTKPPSFFASFPEAKYQAAEPYLAAAVALRPRFAPAHAMLATAFVRQSKIGEAAAASRRALMLDPKNAEAHFLLGFALFDQDDLDGALAEVREAIALDPTYVEAYVGLALILGRRGDVEGGLEALRRALKLDPNSSMAYDNYGNNLYWVQGKTDDAIAAYRRAIELDPKNYWPCLNLSSALRAWAGGRRPSRSNAPPRRSTRNSSRHPNESAYGWSRWKASCPPSSTVSSSPVPSLNGSAWPVYAGSRGGTRPPPDSTTTPSQLTPSWPTTSIRIMVTTPLPSRRLAGTASDEDAVSPDENERTRWRERALAWLRTDLTARTRGLEAATPGDRFFVRKKLRGWPRFPTWPASGTPKP